MDVATPIELYFYTLDIQPTDLIVIYRHHQLMIDDAFERPPTQSPALHLVCLAQDHNIPIQRLRSHWRNRFLIESAYISRFNEIIKKYYPQLAAYIYRLLANP